MGPGVLVEHPVSADLTGMMQSVASEVIGSVEQEDGDAQPTLVRCEITVGSATAMM